MEPWLVATLVLLPVLAEPGPVRLLSLGNGDGPVLWEVDGVPVGATADGEGILVHLGAGAHRVEARSTSSAPWQALVRPEPESGDFQVVPAWWARHTVRPIPLAGPALLAAVLLAAAAWQAKSGSGLRRLP